MVITRNNNGTFTAYQNCISGNKVGFVSEAESLGEAIAGIYRMVIRHCAKTNESPSTMLGQIQQ